MSLLDLLLYFKMNNDLIGFTPPKSPGNAVALRVKYRTGPDFYAESVRHISPALRGQRPGNRESVAVYNIRKQDVCATLPSSNFNNSSKSCWIFI